MPLFIIFVLLKTTDAERPERGSFSFVDCKIQSNSGDAYMADEDDDRCGHDGCSCSVSGDQDYCSDHCRNADDQDITEISCDCGHSGCGIV